MIFGKTVLTLTLISFATLPALAAKQTFTCEQSTDANGNVVYLPVKPQKTAAAKHRMKKHRRMAKAKAHPVIREETKTVDSAPVVTERTEPAPEYRPEPVVATTEERRVEQRAPWWIRHAVNHPIYGNMARAPGDSTLAYMHGTDNPFGKLAYNSDEGPSALRYHNTATDNLEEF